MVPYFHQVELGLACCLEVRLAPVRDHRFENPLEDLLSWGLSPSGLLRSEVVGNLVSEGLAVVEASVWDPAGVRAPVWDPSEVGRPGLSQEDLEVVEVKECRVFWALECEVGKAEQTERLADLSALVQESQYRVALEHPADGFKHKSHVQ